MSPCQLLLPPPPNTGSPHWAGLCLYCTLQHLLYPRRPSASRAILAKRRRGGGAPRWRQCPAPSLLGASPGTPSWPLPAGSSLPHSGPNRDRWQTPLLPRSTHLVWLSNRALRSAGSWRVLPNQCPELLSLSQPGALPGELWAAPCLFQPALRAACSLLASLLDCLLACLLRWKTLGTPTAKMFLPWCVFSFSFHVPDKPPL